MVTFDEAMTMISVARKKAEAMNIKLSFCVVDLHGAVIASARMDGARPMTTENARGKATGAAAFGRPSIELGQMASGPQSQSIHQINQFQFGGRILFAQGAVPIVREGQLEGAFGGSGALSSEDEECVKAGAAAIGA